MANISGMFSGTYFADSPVVITVSDLSWPAGSPFTIVHVEVLYESDKVGEFKADTGGQTEISFDISSAMRAIWAEYDFGAELPGGGSAGHSTRSYSLTVSTEYINTDGVFTTSAPETFNGGACLPGRLTEYERTVMGSTDVSALGSSSGNASTKPATSPERVGVNSMTSTVTISSSGTTNAFHAAGTSGPAVLRDTVPYTDFLFVNRRGALETCSAQTLEAMEIDVQVQQYSRVERPTARPSRTLTAISGDGRRSWSMSSGYQTRDWAEWWAMEFLTARQWWMLYKGGYVPVIVKPAKNQTGIYDRSKQNMPSVEFTVTLALEG